MTRGSNRHDVPSQLGDDWINYDCPVESWEYWEGRFGQAFALKLRNAIALAMTDLRTYRKNYDAPAVTENGRRLDAGEIKRALKKAIKNGSYPSQTIARFVVLHSTDSPFASVAEKASQILGGFTEAPEDYLMERARPETLFTRVLCEMFHRHGMNVSLGSAGTLYGKDGMSPEARSKDAPETAFVEFVRRVVAEQSNPSASYCASVRKVIQRCPICSKL
ncbi:hypothetical protein [Rhodobacter maris]|uniref:Uncharacterized protein n=1 Tax=Rhodobacter maris TaxID=446682 RepID=A0A285SS03_9RHOB|nr:hypothetical protein [Rhodobacter maris]SOC11036.1 hypothetical protein SAMN05877831_108148 [Rhodobacter maris]